jgi:transposase
MSGGLPQSSVLDGRLFLFVNKRGDRLKAMWWDRGGHVVWYWRLERGCFELPDAVPPIPPPVER